MTATDYSSARLWIESYGAYNSGKLIGQWVDVEDAPEIVPTLTRKWGEEGHGDEWGAFDNENCPADTGENPDLEELRDLCRLLEEHGTALDVFRSDVLGAHYADRMSADDLLASFQGHYLGEFDSLADYWAEYSSHRDLEKQIGNLAHYIDYESYGRDMETEGICIYQGHVFNTNAG